MIATVYKCDFCGATRGPENHWLLVRNCFGYFRVKEWDEDEAADPINKHVCGAKCCHVALDRYLESLRKESENG